MARNYDKQTIEISTNSTTATGDTITKADTTANGYNVDTISFSTTHSTTGVVNSTKIQSIVFTADDGFFYTEEPTITCQTNLIGQTIVKVATNSRVYVNSRANNRGKKLLKSITFDIFAKHSMDIQNEIITFGTDIDAINTKQVVDEQILEVLPETGYTVGDTYSIKIKGAENERYRIAVRSGEKYLQQDGTFSLTENFTIGDIPEDLEKRIDGSSNNFTRRLAIEEVYISPDNQELGDFQVEIESMTVDGKIIDRQTQKEIAIGRSVSLKNQTMAGLSLRVSFTETVEGRDAANLRLDGLNFNSNQSFPTWFVGGEGKSFPSGPAEEYAGGIYKFRWDLKRLGSNTITAVADANEAVLAAVKDGLTANGWEIKVCEIGLSGSTTHMYLTIGLQIITVGKIDNLMELSLNSAINVQ